jgi:hypothetical protein
MAGTQRGESDAWMGTFKGGRVDPPTDVHDATAWDEYWKSRLLEGGEERELADQRASDPALPALLARRGVRTILCVGNGNSEEAAALALHGFDVTVLDLSPVLATYVKLSLAERGHPLRRVPGFRLGADGTVHFDAPGPIDPALCPPIHRSEEFAPRGGGSLSFATGDLSGLAVCAGPYDAIIERRTLQHFRDNDLVAGLEKLIQRLAERGTFVSQEHRVGEGPDFVNPHYAEAWLLAHGFARYDGRRPEAHDGAPRLAYLMNTFG